MPGEVQYGAAGMRRKKSLDRRRRRQRGIVLSRQRQPCVYMLTNARNGTLYVGVTSDLLARVVQHRSGAHDGFTRRHSVVHLVYFEMAETMEVAIGREKQLKRYRREWKLNLIERDNPHWSDLAIDLGLPPVAGKLNRQVDPGTRPG